MATLDSIRDAVALLSEDQTLFIPEGFDAFSGLYKIHDVVSRSLKNSVIEAYAITAQYVDLVIKMIIEDDPERNQIKQLIKQNIDVPLVIRTMQHTGQLTNDFYKIYNDFNSTRNALIHKILFNEAKIKEIQQKDIKNLPIKVIDAVNDVFKLHAKKKYLSGEIIKNKYFLVYVIDFAKWNLRRPYKLDDKSTSTEIKTMFLNAHVDFVDEILGGEGYVAKVLKENIFKE